MQSILKRLKENCVNYIEYDKDKRKTFSEVYNDVVSVYEMLKKQGLNSGDRVGLLSQNCYEYLLVDLACIYGGFMMVAFHLNENFKDSEKLFKDYNIKLLVTDDGLEKSEDYENDILYIDKIKEWLNGNGLNSFEQPYVVGWLS